MRFLFFGGIKMKKSTLIFSLLTFLFVGSFVEAMGDSGAIIVRNPGLEPSYSIGVPTKDLQDSDVYGEVAKPVPVVIEKVYMKDSETQTDNAGEFVLEEKPLKDLSGSYFYTGLNFSKIFNIKFNERLVHAISGALGTICSGGYGTAAAFVFGASVPAVILPAAVLGPLAYWISVRHFYKNTPRGLYFEAKKIFEGISKELDEDHSWVLLTPVYHFDDMRAAIFTTFGYEEPCIEALKYIQESIVKLKVALNLVKRALKKTDDAETKGACRDLRNRIEKFEAGMFNKTEIILKSIDYEREVEMRKALDREEKREQKAEVRRKEDLEERQRDRDFAARKGVVAYQGIHNSGQRPVVAVNGN